MLLERVEEILFKTCGLEPSCIVVAGVSGGADSIAMLDLLLKAGLQVSVAHLNHQLRPSAAQEAAFVCKAAEHYGVDFFTKSMDVKHRVVTEKESVEEAARNARYQFLFDTADKVGAAAVVVAHQADDQVETILMNLLRGTGLNGLTGMQPCSLSAYHATIPLVRPLLGCWREEIEAYCQSEGLTYVTDESNKDVAYRRNRIRVELIPELETYNPRIKQSLLQMGSLLSTDKAFLDNYLQDISRKVTHKTAMGYTAINLQQFIDLNPAVQRALVKQVLNQAFPQEKSLGAVHYEDVRKLLTREIASTNMQVNEQIILRIENGLGVFLPGDMLNMPSEQWPSIEQTLQVHLTDREYALGKNWKLIIEKVEADDLAESYRTNIDLFRAFLDAGKLESALTVRTWQAGDRFKPLGMHGKSIKLSDFWINQKIPRRAKEFWPLVFSAGELVWIPGFQVSEIAKVSVETREIVILRVLKEN